MSSNQLFCHFDAMADDVIATESYATVSSIIAVYSYDIVSVVLEVQSHAIVNPLQTTIFLL